MTQIFKSNSKIKLFLFFLLAVVLTLGLSLSLQSVSAALFETVPKGVKVGDGSLQLPASTDNLIYGVISSTNANGSLILLQTGTGVDKFRVDHNGNVTLSGTIDGYDISAKAPVWDAKEPAITAGTTAQYWRGDKTWQPLPGGGDITGVTAGTGLSGGGVSGDVTITADATYLQRRVSSSCIAGSSIRVINADGTVSCETDDTGGVTDIWVDTAGDTMTGNLAINSQQLNHNTDNPFYINSYDSLQLRINSDGAGASDFGVNNSANTRVFTVTNAGNVTLSGTIDGYDISAKAPVWDAKMTNPMTAVGDIIYGGAGGTPTKLAGAAGFLKSTGAVAPSFSALVAADIPSLDAAKITSGTFADARIASAATWNAKAPTASPTFTGNVTMSGTPGSYFSIFKNSNTALSLGGVAGATSRIYVYGETFPTASLAGSIWLNTADWGKPIIMQGYVGIGTTNPGTYRLNVNGSFNASSVCIAGDCKSSWPVIGTVTSVTATAPVVSSGGTAPNISMPAATASANGYMTSAYASKLDGIAAGATVGITQAAADTRYVNTTGDVMTDSLTISGGSLVLGPGTDGTISISRSGGRNYFAPYDAGYQYGREFGYDSAIDRWYVENNFTISGCLETGAGCNELFAMNQNVRTFDNPTFATVNTGLGANELYAMNQNVRTTDSPTFVRLRTGGNTDGTSWNVGITGFVIQRSGNVVLGIDSGNVGIGTTNPTQKLDVAGYVRGSSGLCIGNDCRTSWPVSTAPNLQCPPKRVMVDETSANWDEWASYDTCSPTSNYVEFYGTRIYDNGSGLYVDTQASDAWGCIPYCQEFGFRTGQRINTISADYRYQFFNGRWRKGYCSGCGLGASSCRCYP